VGPRAGLDGGGEERNSQPLPGLEPLIIQRYTTQLSRLLDFRMEPPVPVAINIFSRRMNEPKLTPEVQRNEYVRDEV
jgi:hypothetical protein